MSVHIAAIEYALPQQSITLDELARDGRLSSDPDTLRSFGFDRAWAREIVANLKALIEP